MSGGDLKSREPSQVAAIASTSLKKFYVAGAVFRKALTHPALVPMW